MEWVAGTPAARAVSVPPPRPPAGACWAMAGPGGRVRAYGAPRMLCGAIAGQHVETVEPMPSLELILADQRQAEHRTPRPARPQIEHQVDHGELLLHG